jgi:hypothetical protein
VLNCSLIAQAGRPGIDRQNAPIEEARRGLARRRKGAEMKSMLIYTVAQKMQGVA